MPRRDVSPAASTEAPRGSRPASQNALSGSCTGTASQSSRTKPKRQLPLIEWPCALAQPLQGVPIESPWTTRAGQDILEVTNERGSNSAGRVPASQAGCRGFESRLPLRMCGRSCDRPLRASDLSAASFLRSASAHRLAPRGRDPPDPSARGSVRIPPRHELSRGKPASSRITCRSYADEPARARSSRAAFLHSAKSPRRQPPLSAGRSRSRPDHHVRRRPPHPAPSRKGQTHSRNSDEIRSSHRIERLQKRASVVARPLQMIEWIDGQGVQCAAGSTQDSFE